jgi:excisionase family DNA binding protein
MNNRITFTPEMDEQLRQAYLNYRPGMIMKLASEWNCSHKLIRRRANQLNLPIVKSHNGIYRRWSSKEIRLLLEYEQYTCRQLSVLLNKHGFDRTEGSIDCFRRKHHRWLDKQHRDEFSIGYTTFQLEELLGVDNSTIRRWIIRGWMKGQQHGPNYRVRREHLLLFLIENPGYWKFNHVDTYWFTDLILEFMAFKPT